MKRIYLTIMTILAVLAGTQVQAFQEKHLDPRNWSKETVNREGYVGYAAKSILGRDKAGTFLGWFGYELAVERVTDPIEREYALVRRQYYVNKIAEDTKMHENERKNLVNISGFMKIAPHKTDGIGALIAETCGNPNMPQSECDKAIAELENATRDMKRYAADRKQAELAMGKHNSNIQKYEKKIQEFDAVIDAYDAEKGGPVAWVASWYRKFGSMTSGSTTVGQQRSSFSRSTPFAKITAGLKQGLVNMDNAHYTQKTGLEPQELTRYFTSLKANVTAKAQRATQSFFSSK